RVGWGPRAVAAACWLEEQRCTPSNLASASTSSLERRRKKATRAIRSSRTTAPALRTTLRPPPLPVRQRRGPRSFCKTPVAAAYDNINLAAGQDHECRSPHVRSAVLRRLFDPKARTDNTTGAASPPATARPLASCSVFLRPASPVFGGRIAWPLTAGTAAF